ncbi:polyprenyl synthetase family protein [Micrococcus lylae]|uniref:polyprenyl synthetase family protein n=1 Tax=Micrococcus lylae TaxID=1273 RepID=UPI003EB6CEF2
MTTSTDGFTLPAGFESLAGHGRVLDTVTDALDAVETQLHEALTSDDVFAETSSRHLLTAGGKRIRPVLTVMASLIADPELGSGDVAPVNPAVRQAAVVMELTHLATLYHDDVMDEAPVRRGVETAHRLWGNSAAILAGDLVFARASQLMSELGPRAVRVQSDTFERLVMGQLWETRGVQDGEDHLEHYLQVIGGKTGSLIAASGMLGALLGGADEETVQILAAYGEEVGLAFQLADDLIDLTSTEEQLGKAPGTDLREGVPTLTTILLRGAAVGAGAEAQSAREALELVDGPLDTDEQLAAAVAAVTAHPVMERAWEMTRAHAARAKQILAPLPDSAVKDALAGFADYVVDRSS